MTDPRLSAQHLWGASERPSSEQLGSAQSSSISVGCYSTFWSSSPRPLLLSQLRRMTLKRSAGPLDLCFKKNVKNQIYLLHVLTRSFMMFIC